MELVRRQTARKIALDIEMRNRPPEDDDDEPRAMVVGLPDAYVPQDSSDRFDEEPS
jgi:hypothetical protein